MGQYGVRFDRDRKSGWWVVHVPDVEGCRSRGRTLDEARRRIREALGHYVDDADDATFDEDIRLPGAVRRPLERTLAARRRAEDAQAEAAWSSREAAQVLVEEFGLSRRDAGALLGVSHQRVQQLIHERREDLADEEGIRQARAEQGDEPAESWDKVKAELGVGSRSTRAKKKGSRPASKSWSAARSAKIR